VDLHRRVSRRATSPRSARAAPARACRAGVGWRRTARIGHLFAPLPPDVGEFELSAVVPVPPPHSFNNSSNSSNLPASRACASARPRPRGARAGARGARENAGRALTPWSRRRRQSRRAAPGCARRRASSRRRGSRSSARCTARSPGTAAAPCAQPTAAVSARPPARRARARGACLYDSIKVARGGGVEETLRGDQASHRSQMTSLSQTTCTIPILYWG